ncbi:MAG: argininosuccinate synthase [Deltaproteobacteria bacterium]|nr:argininosuccinate synthase [Deltaproteobacteria bacterium]MBW2046437.1 argininosuccinate synthase [Deltaproteobacteria bacterium]MBW2299147.1 argininosuccinate synthase [Deltaproteobacteria bacterium]
MSEKVVLAYSGGLDTSVILKWLLDKGYEVVAYMADVGQEEDFEAARKKALDIGAAKVYVEDLKNEFVTDFIFPAIRANAVYEGKYLLGTSLARPLIAKRQVEIARKEGTTIVAHGATGKGNDQVRFEMSYYVLMPDVKIISLWKDEGFLSRFRGRTDMINFANEKGIPVPVTADKPYSMDDNLMHISYEAGVLENPRYEPQKDMFRKTTDPVEAPDTPEEIMIEFQQGNPVLVRNLSDKTEKKGALELFQYFNVLAGKHGIGRVDMVENRFVGMKSRGVYETPGGTILMQAHLDIEGLTMDREVKLLRDSLIPKYAQLIYFGFWYSPEMEVLRALMDKAQEHVSGKVYLKLYKGNVIIQGRESEESLYDEKTASMDIHGGYDQKDAIGFIRLNALRLRASAKRLK